jgi:hypothetical protein
MINPSLISVSLSILCVLSVLTMATSTHAAVVTTQMDIGFNGSLSGTAYTLGANELLNSGSFSTNGTPTISGGVAKLDGSSEADSNVDGLKYITGITLKTTSYFVEARFRMDVINSPANINEYIISIGSGNDIRFNNGNLTFAYSGPLINLSAVAPTVGQYCELAVLWDATAKQFSIWRGLTPVAYGVSGTTYNTLSSFPDNINFGWFDLNTFTGRGSNATFDRVALSTFTGSFDPNSFLFVPEASTSILSLSSLGLLFLRKRNSHSKA